MTARRFLVPALLAYGLLGVLDFLAVARGGVRIGLLYEYLLSAAGLVFFARYVRHRAEARGRPARPSSETPVGQPEGFATRPAAAASRVGRDGRTAVLAGVGLFAVIMVLRLYLYGTTGQVWGKAPMLVLTLAAALGYEGWHWDDLGLPARRVATQIALGALACLWTWVLITASYLLTDLVFVGSVAVGWAKPEVTGLAVLGLALRFLQGNFAEELFFRGYLLHAWEKPLGRLGSLLGQALFFGLFHVNYYLFPPRPIPILMYVLFSAAFGLAMGIITRRAGTLIPAAMAHPFYNLTIACGLASIASSWQASPRAPVAVTVATYLIQLALYWWALPRLMDWSVRMVGATPPGDDIPCRPSGARSRRVAPPRGASPAG